MGRLRGLTVGIATFLIILANVLTVSAAEPAIPAASSVFKDVDPNHLAMPYIKYLAGKGVINGYPDQTFHPNSGLTRAEAAVVLCRAAGLTADKQAGGTFRDVPQNHWAKAYIMTASKAGYLKGNPDNTYRPEQKLTRAEGIVLIFRLSKSDISQATLPQLTDINNKHWAARPVAAALESGMVGLSEDKKKFMPDAPFTRINLAQALGILLTEDPSLYKTALPGTLKTVTGKITLKKAGSDKEVTVTQEAVLNAGDIITSVQGAKAEVNYPDGSSLLIKDDTQVIVKASDGRKYIKLDGSEGIAVDWLNVDMKKGTMFTALATKHDDNEANSGQEKTSHAYPPVMATLAGTNFNGILGTLAANAPAGNQQWYQVAQAKKVKVQVDMPWGVAAVRGTFVLISIDSSGRSNVSCLTGTAEVSAGGQTVPLTQNQATQVTEQQAPPPPPAPIPQAQVQQFAQETQWVQQTAQVMDQQQEAAPPPPPPPAPVEQPNVPVTPAPVTPVNPTAPTTTTTNPTPAAALQAVQRALSSVGVSTSSGNSPAVAPAQPPRSSSSGSSAAPLGQAVSISRSQMIFAGGTIVDFGTSTIPQAAQITVSQVPTASISQYLGTTGLTTAGPVLDFSLTNYAISQPIQVKLPLTSGTNPDKAGIFYYNTATAKWEYVPTQIASGYAVASITHFSIYGVLLDQTAPINPAAKVKSINAGTIELELMADDVSGIARYEVYRDGTKIATVEGMLYTDNGLAIGNSYVYTIKAIDKMGNISAESSPLSVQVTNGPVLESIYNGPRNLISVNFNSSLSTSTLATNDLKALVSSVKLISGGIEQAVEFRDHSIMLWWSEGSSTKLIIPFNEPYNINVNDIVEVTLTENVKTVYNTVVSPNVIRTTVQSDTTPPTAAVVNATAGTRDWIGLQFSEELYAGCYSGVYSNLNNYVQVYIGDELITLGNRIKWFAPNPDNRVLVIPFISRTLGLNQPIKIVVTASQFRDAAGNPMPGQELSTVVTADNNGPLLESYASLNMDGSTTLEFSELVNTAASESLQFSSSALNFANYQVIRLDNQQQVDIVSITPDTYFPGHTLVRMAFDPADLASMTPMAGLLITANNIVDYPAGLPINPAFRSVLVMTGGGVSSASASIDYQSTPAQVNMSGIMNTTGTNLTGNAEVVVLLGPNVIKQQTVTFTNGSASIPVPAALNLPGYYNLSVIVSGNPPLSVTYNTAGQWDTVGQPFSDISQSISKLSLDTKAERRFVMTTSPRIYVNGFDQDNNTWLVEEEGSTGSNAVVVNPYYAYESASGIVVKEKTTGWSVLGSSPGTGTNLNLEVGSYDTEIARNRPYVAYRKTDNKLAVSVFTRVYLGNDQYENRWVDISGSQTPTMAGALDFKVDQQYADGSLKDVLFAAMVEADPAVAGNSRVGVYARKDGAWIRLGNPIPVNARYVSLAISKGVPFLAVGSVDNIITGWVLKGSEWDPMPQVGYGTNPLLKISKGGTSFLSFIDMEGTTCLYKYAFLGYRGSNPYYAWIGGKVHAATTTSDISNTFAFAGEDVYLGFTNGTDARVGKYRDPLMGVTCNVVNTNTLLINRISTDVNMQYSLNGIDFTNWVGDQITISDLNTIDPYTGIIVQTTQNPNVLLPTDQTVRLLPNIIAPELAEGTYSQPELGLTYGKTRIANLPAIPAGYNWRVKVQYNKFYKPILNSYLADTQEFPTDHEITVNPGDHILLMATEPTANGLFKIKSFADIKVDPNRVAGYAHPHMFMPSVYGGSNPVAYLYDDDGQPVANKQINFYSVAENDTETLLNTTPVTTLSNGRADCPVAPGAETRIRAKLAGDTQYVDTIRNAMAFMEPMEDTSYRQIMLEQYAYLKMRVLQVYSDGSIDTTNSLMLKIDSDRNGRFEGVDYSNSSSTTAYGLLEFNIDPTDSRLPDGYQYAAIAYSTANPNHKGYSQFEKALGNTALFVHATASVNGNGQAERLYVNADLHAAPVAGRIIDFFIDWTPGDTNFNSSNFNVNDHTVTTGDLIYLKSMTVPVDTHHIEFEEVFTTPPTISSGAILAYYAGDLNNRPAMVVVPIMERVLPAVTEERIFTNWNVDGVAAGPGTATTFTINQPYALTYIDTYHDNSGSPAGDISLKHADGSIYGPWAATLDSTNDVWIVNHKVSGQLESSGDDLGTLTPGSQYPVLKPGTYTVLDSNTGTWSWNGTSGGAGFAQIKGYPMAVNAMPAAAISGSIVGRRAADIVAGNNTIIINLANVEWADDIAANTTLFNSLADNIYAEGAEASEWLKVVNALKAAGVSSITRESETQVTITLVGVSDYNLVDDQRIFVRIPKECLKGIGYNLPANAPFVIHWNDPLSTWNPLSLPGSLTGLAVGNNQVMAVGTPAHGYSSANGTVWDSADPGANDQLKAVAYGPDEVTTGVGRYIAVGSILGPNTSMIKRLDDGGSWQDVGTVASPPASYNDVTYDVTQGFVALGGNKVYTSADGINWDVHTPGISANGNLYSVAAGNGIIVAVGYEQPNINDFRLNYSVAYTSNDGGATWAAHTVTAANDKGPWLQDISFANGVFVACENVQWVGGESPKTIYTSTNGASWNPSYYTTPSIAEYFLGSAYGNGIWLVYSETGIYKSTNNGASWKRVYYPPGNIRSMVYFSNAFIAVGDQGSWCCVP